MKSLPMHTQLEQLRTELIDRAYLLDRGGRADAADLANEMAGRIGELVAESQLESLREEKISAGCPDGHTSFVGTVNHPD